MNSQNEKIRKHLLNGKSLTPLGALRLFQCFRLASRVNDLRKQGMKIKTEMITKNKKTYANYRLDKLKINN